MTPGEQQLVTRVRSRPSSGVPRREASFGSSASLLQGAAGKSLPQPHTKSAAGLLMGTPAASCPR